MITSINEYISNYSLVNHLIYKFYDKISKSGLPIRLSYSADKLEERTLIYFSILINEDIPNFSMTEDIMNKLGKLIKNNIHIFTNNDYIVGTRKAQLYYQLAVKRKYTHRYHPNQGFLYHMTTFRRNLPDIADNGLKVLPSSESIEWSKDETLTYPPAIFATIPPHTWVGSSDYFDSKVIKINTEGLSNKWWYDLNLFHRKDSDYVMTFEPIPPEFLEFCDTNTQTFHSMTSDELRKKYGI